MPIPTSKQNNLIVSLIVILGLTGGYLYYTFISSPMAIPKVPLPEKDNLQAFKNARINLPSDERIKNLKTFGESPVVPSSAGKKDIFAPF